MTGRDRKAGQQAMARKKISERLHDRLRGMGLGEHCGEGLRPLRASRADRNAGAWSWSAFGPGVPVRLGSHWPMADLLAAEQLVASLDPDTGDICVDPWTATHGVTALGEWVQTRYGQILVEQPNPHTPGEE